MANSNTPTAVRLTYVGGKHPYTSATLDDGATVYLGQLSWDAAIVDLEQRGVCCKRLKADLDEWVKGDLPPKPVQAKEFQHGYGYKPVKEVLSWDYSTTFGRWGAVVVFKGETRQVYTFPKPE